MTAPSRPIFPILMRALRIALVFLTHYHSLLVKNLIFWLFLKIIFLGFSR